MLDELYKIVCDLNAKGIVLNRNGIFDTTKSIPKLGSEQPFTKELIEELLPTLTGALKMTPLLVRTTKRKFLVSSYGLKHVVEKFLDPIPYIANGDMILIMIHMKYDYTLAKESNINCRFACKYVDSDAVEVCK